MRTIRTAAVIVLVGFVGACSAMNMDAPMDANMKMDGGMKMDGAMNMDGGMNMDGMAEGVPTSEAIAPVQGAAVYVVNGGANSISVLDAQSHAVLGTIALKNVAFPHHVYLNSDASRMLVAVPGMDLSEGHNGATTGMKGVVMLLAADTGKTLAARTLDAMNHNAAFSPDGREVWTTQMDMGGSVLVLDPATLATRSTIKVGDMPAEVTFSKDRKYGFVANGMSNDVSVIDVVSKKVVKTIAVGEDPVGAWPGDDGSMYVDCEKGKVVSVIDPSTMAVVRTYNLGFTPGMARTTPDGSALWVSSDDQGKVAVYMTTSTMKMKEIVTGAGAHGIVFSADGKTGFVTNQGAGTVSVVDVATSKVMMNVPVGAKPNGLVYRPKP